ncbi:hypothetical protein BDQ17DRAFT_1384350 [Cyathus striatus]|nr:hypothetical protein BDQ17DRAFT_1384350 [Cyathus striatus]
MIVYANSLHFFLLSRCCSSVHFISSFSEIPWWSLPMAASNTDSMASGVSSVAYMPFPLGWTRAFAMSISSFATNAD